MTVLRRPPTSLTDFRCQHPGPYPRASTASKSPTPLSTPQCPPALAPHSHASTSWSCRCPAEVPHGNHTVFSRQLTHCHRPSSRDWDSLVLPNRKQTRGRASVQQACLTSWCHQAQPTPPGTPSQHFHTHCAHFCRLFLFKLTKWELTQKSVHFKISNPNILT